MCGRSDNLHDDTRSDDLLSSAARVGCRKHGNPGRTHGGGPISDNGSQLRTTELVRYSCYVDPPSAEMALPGPIPFLSHDTGSARPVFRQGRSSRRLAHMNHNQFLILGCIGCTLAIAVCEVGGG